jgi:serine protease AprX
MPYSNPIRLIIECENVEKIEEICTVKYHLPLINCFVVETDMDNLDILKNLKGVNAIHQNTHITMQMNRARALLHADNSDYTGKGITIAILDTGIVENEDFKGRVILFKDFVNNNDKPYDDNGHGMHVSGICCGNGALSNGLYRGIAPEANIIMLKTLNNEGRGNAADVLAGIQWIANNKDKYNIRIANMSIGTETTGDNDPLVRAVEALWNKGVVVVTAAGNNGPAPGTISSPGISRKVITVGSSDDDVEVQIYGSAMKNFSGRGPTPDCIIKPDVVTPGSDIVSCLSPDAKSVNKRVGNNYQCLSGTSMSTPMVSGAIALLLQKHPDLSPDDVKYMLKLSSTDLNYPRNHQGWGLINIEKLLSQEVVYVRK